MPGYFFTLSILFESEQEYFAHDGRISIAETP